MSSTKITVFGAGSVVFSLALVKDLCLTKGLSDSTVCFMDIDEEKLDVVYQLAKRYAEDLGANLKFEKTTCRQAAFEGADFVINTATISHNEYQMKAAREALAKLGYYYSTSAGMPEYYNLQLMLEVGQDMERFCPDAWMILAGNPVFDCTTLVTRETDIKMIGLCHGHYGYQSVARTLGIEDVENITWQAPGLNHNIWLTHFYYKGQDLYPRLDEWIANEAEDYWAAKAAAGEEVGYQMSPAAIWQYKMMGLMPIGDTPRTGGWWATESAENRKRWYGGSGAGDTPEGRNKILLDKEAKYAEMKTAAYDAKVRPVDLFGSEKTREQHIGIIDALVNDNEGQFQVNIPNYGALPGIPDDVAVEVPAIVNIKGVLPIRVEPLPAKVMLERIYPNWLRMELELEAVLSGDKSMLLYGILQDHQTRSYDQALEALDAVFSLPRNEPAKQIQDINEHFSWPKNW